MSSYDETRRRTGPRKKPEVHYIANKRNRASGALATRIKIGPRMVSIVEESARAAAAEDAARRRRQIVYDDGG